VDVFISAWHGDDSHANGGRGIESQAQRSRNVGSRRERTSRFLGESLENDRIFPKAVEREISLHHILRSPERSDRLAAREQCRVDPADCSGLDRVKPGDSSRRNVDPAAFFLGIAKPFFVAEQTSRA